MYRALAAERGADSASISAADAGGGGSSGSIPLPQVNIEEIRQLASSLGWQEVQYNESSRVIGFMKGVEVRQMLPYMMVS